MFLKVDMSRAEVSSTAFPEEKVIGGRAIVDYILTDYGKPEAHALAEESPFIVAPGLFGGTSAPQSGRISVGGKSPLTGGIKESNSGGTAGHALGRLGIRAIMVTGSSKEYNVLVVSRGSAYLEPANDIVGLGNYKACEILRERYGSDISIIITGIAGEMRMASATVAITDPEGRPCRQCGRGGLGALMAAKGLKAIVVPTKGGQLRKAFDSEGFKEAAKKATETIKNAEVTNIFHTFGTCISIDGEHGRGGLPSYNHSQGSFDKVDGLRAQTLVDTCNNRGGAMGHGCMPGCIVRCSPIFHDAEGNFVTAGFEYETIAMFGANLGIGDLDPIARMDFKCDDWGIDTIELGCALGVLTETDFLNFGDSDKAEALLDEVGKGTPLGRILGNGTVVTARAFGIARVPAVKGQGIPAHAGRALKGWGTTYATSPQGADHTAGIVEDDPLSPEGQVERSRNAQIWTAGLDATGFCLFTFLQPDVIVPMINHFYGIEWTENDFLELGREMLRQERQFNKKAGIVGDGMPEWMTKEKLPPNGTVFDVSQAEIEQTFNF